MDSWEDTCNVLAYLPTAVSESSSDEGSVHARTGIGNRGLRRVLSRASTRDSSGSSVSREVLPTCSTAVVVPPPVKMADADCTSSQGLVPGGVYEWGAPPALETKYFEDGSYATLQPDGSWLVAAVGLPMFDSVVPPAPPVMFEKP